MSTVTTTTLSILMKPDTNILDENNSNPDTSNTTREESPKKSRKKREKKESTLEKFGWDTSLSWSLPRFRKFMSDSNRAVTGILRGIYFNKDGDITSSLGLDSCGGVIVTVERGPRVEHILIITEFSVDWINNENFIKLIEPFTSTSKSSRFVLISPEAKSWGKSKVITGKEMMRNIMLPFSKDDIPINIVDIDSSNTAVEKKVTLKLKIRSNKHVRIPLRKEPITNSINKTELVSILANFNQSIVKIEEAFNSLQKSLDSMRETSVSMDSFIKNA